MYTIRQAAIRSGVPVPTIRAWERRYGLSSPARTASGYRLYDDEAIRRLVAVRRLVAEGWQASVAAAGVLNGSVGTGQAAQPGDAAARLAPQLVGAADRDEVSTIGRRFVEAAAALDEAEVGRVLDDAFAHGSFERVVSDLLFPALRELGTAWADGRVSVAGEHLATHTVLRRLGVALDAAGAGDPAAARVVVGLPPGSRHELGALAFAIALRRAGIAVAYVGPDLPVEDWVRAAAEADAAVVGVVTPRDRRTATSVVRHLQGARPELVVAVGGSAADSVAEQPGVVRLPPELDAAIAAIRAVLNSRSERG